MTDTDYKGLRCPNPNCNAIQQFKTGQQTKIRDAIRRPKICKVCGTIMETIEVPIGTVEIKNDHDPSAVAPVQPPTPPVSEAPLPVAPLPTALEAATNLATGMSGIAPPPPPPLA